MRSLPAVAALAAALALATPAAAAPPAPFGHPCTPRSGVLFCPTDTLGDRVPTWDGVPLDVDVTLPATGDGPFPTLFLEHGYPGHKGTFETLTAEGDGGATYHYNNVFYAQQGYAVVNLSARGFGRSCGVPESRTAGCERGWTHLADQRYEVRDVQHLMGMLVDQGVADPQRLLVSGLSGGGGRAIALAFLKDRIRRPDGSFAPWTSPSGTPLAIARAFSRWGWYDLPSALVPNGRPRAGRVGSEATSTHPVGIPKRHWLELLYLGGTVGFLSPPGADPQADLTTWLRLADTDPDSERVRDVVATLARYIGGGVGIPGTPAPLLMEDGWTDELFPGDEALRAAKRARRAGGTASVMLGDLGHGWAGNAAATDRAFNDAGAAFLGGAPTPGVLVAPSTCPKGSARPPLTASTLGALQTGTLRLRKRDAHTLTSAGGDRDVARALDGTSGTWCDRVEVSGRNAIVLQRRSRGETLIGSPQIRAHVRARGDDAQLAARLLDVDAGEGRLIARGVVRVTDNEDRLRLNLHPNFYEFPEGHRIRLELLGSDPPYAQDPTADFRVRVRNVRLRLPVR
jgi:hypothetical protein